MFKVYNRKIIPVIITVAIVLILSRNLIITGNIAGEQKVFKIGLLKTNDTRYSHRGDQVSYGLNRGSSTSFWGRFRLELVVRDDTDLNSSINDFINGGTKAIFVVNTYDVLKISEILNENKILVFHSSGALSLYELGNYTFSFRDFYLIPTLILADAVNNLDIKRVGVVYIKPPVEQEHLDDSSDIFNLTFSKMSGKNVLFKTTYYVENKSNSTEILNLINSTKPEALVFLGYGTGYEELIDLLSEIRNYNNTIKIFSLGLGTMRDISGILSDVLEGVITIEDNFMPKRPLNVMSYAFFTGTYVTIEILKNLLTVCKDDTDCVQEKLHENTFDTSLGKVGFTKNGVMIRPYLLYEVDQGIRVPFKEYGFDDIEKIVNDYGLKFLE